MCHRLGKWKNDARIHDAQEAEVVAAEETLGSTGSCVSSAPGGRERKYLRRSLTYDSRSISHNSQQAGFHAMLLSVLNRIYSVVNETLSLGERYVREMMPSHNRCVCSHELRHFPFWVYV